MCPLETSVEEHLQNFQVLSPLCSVQCKFVLRASEAEKTKKVKQDKADKGGSAASREFLLQHAA